MFFKKTYEKEYDSDEEKKRFKCFEDNVKKITDHNEKYDAGQSTFRMGLNKFADYTSDELQNLRGFSPKG